MSDSPRWHLDGLPGTTGIVEVMLYADHVAAVAAARQDGYNAAWSLSAAEIERQVREEEQVAQSLAVAESFAAGVKAARDAVAGLPVLLVDVRFNPDDASRYVGAVNVTDALAAIDALKNYEEEK